MPDDQLRMKKINFVILLVLFFQSSGSFAQEQDAGLWLTANIEKKINNNWKAALSQEFRLKENYSQLGTYFTDIGIQYKISKSFNASLNYRFIEKLQPDLTYDERNRLYLDIAYRYKQHKWNVIFRTRFQDQIKSVGSNEDFSEPQYYWRNKLTVKHSIKKFDPYLSFELFYPLNKPEGNEIDEWRISLGTSYELNKKNSLNGYFLVDKEINVNNPLTSFITGIEYTFSF